MDDVFGAIDPRKVEFGLLVVAASTALVVGLAVALGMAAREADETLERDTMMPEEAEAMRKARAKRNPFAYSKKIDWDGTRSRACAAPSPAPGRDGKTRRPETLTGSQEKQMRRT